MQAVQARGVVTPSVCSADDFGRSAAVVTPVRQGPGELQVLQPRCGEPGLPNASSSDGHRATVVGDEGARRRDGHVQVRGRGPRGAARGGRGELPEVPATTPGGSLALVRALSSPGATVSSFDLGHTYIIVAEYRAPRTPAGARGGGGCAVVRRRGNLAGPRRMAAVPPRGHAEAALRWLPCLAGLP